MKNLFNVKEDLGLREKIEAQEFLRTAELAVENQKTREKIEVLEELEKTLEHPGHLQVVQDAIKDYRREVRKKDAILNTNYGQAFDDYTPLTFGDLLTAIGATVDEKTGEIKIKPELLGKKIKVAEDDGMGYAISGFSDVFSGYVVDNDIQLWI